MKATFFLMAMFAYSHIIVAQVPGRVSQACEQLGSDLISNGDFNSGNSMFLTSYSLHSGCEIGGLNGSGQHLKSFNIQPIKTCYNVNDRNNMNGMTLHFPDIDAPNVGALFWGQTVPVNQNKKYELTLWVYEPTGNCPYQPQGTMYNVYINNVLIKADNVGGCGTWFKKVYSWQSNVSTNANIEIKNAANNFQDVKGSYKAGMDLVIDGISMFECGGEVPTQISEMNKKSQWHIGPNPGQGIYYLKNEVTGKCTVSIYNALGALVQRTGFDGDEYQLDIQANSAGLYFVLIEQGEASAQRLKILKE